MNEKLKREERILEIFSEIFIFMIIVLFPLIVDKTGFFKILECKWYAYIAITTTYLVGCLLMFLYFLIVKKINYFKNKKLGIVQWLAIIFLIINILSCLFSPFRQSHDLLVGVGRGEGLIIQSLYILSFLFVTMFARFKKRHILYFSISSVLVNFIGVLQYFGFNPLNMYQDGIGIHNVSFLATIGNIDFVSAFYTIVVTISFVAFIFLEEKRINKIIHILSVLFGFMMIAIIDVTGGKLAMLVMLAIVFPFIVLENKRLARFLIMIVTIVMAYCINLIINPEYHLDNPGIHFYFQFNIFTLSFLIISLMLVFLSYLLYKRNYNYLKNKTIVKSYYLILIGCGIAGLIGLYFINFKSGILYEIHELLHGNFDDNFGTYRVFLWKRTITLIKQYPILGSGCDTFAIRFMAKYTADIAALGELSLNDTAANVYLTMVINLGIVGLVSYLTFIGSQLKEGIKRINKYSGVLLVGLACYLIQDFFNLSVVIVSPILWMLMAVHYRSIFDKIN